MTIVHHHRLFDQFWRSWKTKRGTYLLQCQISPNTWRRTTLGARQRGAAVLEILMFATSFFIGPTSIWRQGSTPQSGRIMQLCSRIWLTQTTVWRAGTSTVLYNTIDITIDILPLNCHHCIWPLLPMSKKNFAQWCPDWAWHECKPVEVPDLASGRTFTFTSSTLSSINSIINRLKRPGRSQCGGRTWWGTHR